MDDVFFMNLALIEAEASLQDDTLPIGAIIVSGNEVLSRGHRSLSGNTRLDHAEMNALCEAVTDWRGEHMTLYTTLEPCIMCFGAILNCRIGRVVYALEDSYGGATNLNPAGLPLRHQIKYPMISGGVLREESKRLFRRYFQMTENEFWKNNFKNPFYRLCMIDS